MTTLNSIARQEDALPGNMSAYAANFLNDWGETLSELLTPIYTYLFGDRITPKKQELDVINRKMVKKLSLYRSEGMPINVSCVMNGVKQIVVLEETKQGVKISSNGKEVIMKKIASFDRFYFLLKQEVEEVEEESELKRMRESPYAIDTFVEWF